MDYLRRQRHHLVYECEKCFREITNTLKWNATPIGSDCLCPECCDEEFLQQCMKALESNRLLPHKLLEVSELTRHIVPFAKDCVYCQRKMEHDALYNVADWMHAAAAKQPVHKECDGPRCQQCGSYHTIDTWFEDPAFLVRFCPCQLSAWREVAQLRLLDKFMAFDVLHAVRDHFCCYARKARICSFLENE